MGSDHRPTIITYNEPVYSDTTGIPSMKVELADWPLYKESCRLVITSDLMTADVDIFNANLVEAKSKAVESSIPQTKPSRKVKYKYLPYWNRQCKEAIKSRNRARNKMNRSKKLENTIDYRRLKCIAQRLNLRPKNIGKITAIR